jgi:hypothetical protein
MPQEQGRIVSRFVFVILAERRSDHCFAPANVKQPASSCRGLDMDCNNVYGIGADARPGTLDGTLPRASAHSMPRSHPAPATCRGTPSHSSLVMPLLVPVQSKITEHAEVTSARRRRKKKKKKKELAAST